MCEGVSDNPGPRRELSGERVCGAGRLEILPREEETKDPLVSLTLELLRPWWVQWSPRGPVGRAGSGVPPQMLSPCRSTRAQKAAGPASPCVTSR